MCQAIMRCSVSIHGGGDLGCWLRAKESETGGWARRGEARLAIGCAQKVVEKGKGKWRWRSPTATSTHFCPPQRSLNCASPFSFTLPLKIGVVSAGQPPECLWAGRGLGRARKWQQLGREAPENQRANVSRAGCAVLEFCLEIHPSRPLLCERLASDTTALSECVLLRRGTRAPFSLLTDSPIPCDFRRRRYEVGKKKKGKGLLTVMCKRRLLRHGLKE
ncbi:hypothetical protein F5883DRAFT_117381 [Diaporthe sp. PMI_573]|nr:hypothetical protein F5883DRAFT_117381 [Diaporthaceae sp. PMI_573]